MGLKNCQIQLDNPWNTYYAGQTINGQVTLTFDSPKKVRGIRLQAIGEAESKQKGKKSSKKEMYELYSDFLTGGEQQTIDITAGTIEYQFHINTPSKIPSSFEGKHGKIKYLLILELVTIEFATNYRIAQIEVKIIHNLDLNLDPKLRHPFNMKMHKTFYSITRCCTGPLNFNLDLPKTGFIPGDKIPLNIECENKSNLQVKEIKITLRQINNYHVAYLKQDFNIIAEKNLGSVAPKETKNLYGELEIPARIQPISTIYCNCIFVHYELSIRLVMNIFHRDLRGSFPISLGTVPVHLNFIQPEDFKPQLMQKKAQHRRCIPSIPYECCNSVYVCL